MFGLSWFSMALHSIACPCLNSPLLLHITLVCYKPLFVIFRFLKIFYSRTGFNFQNSCCACYHATMKLMMGLIHMKWKLFTSINTSLFQLLYNEIHILTVLCILCICHQQFLPVCIYYIVHQGFTPLPFSAFPFQIVLFLGEYII